MFRFWGDDTPYGLAGVLVLVLTFVFMIAYTAVGAPLGITMLAYALLWRNDRKLRDLVPGSRRSYRTIAARQAPGSCPRRERQHMTGTSLQGRPWSRVRHGHHQPPAGRSAGRYTAASLAPGGRGGTQAGLAGVARGGALNLVGAAVSAVATIGLTVVGVTRR